MKILQMEITRTETIFSTNFGGKLSFFLSFLLMSASTATTYTFLIPTCTTTIVTLEPCATYIFTAPTCTTTIITLEPCVLNAEFQHFIP